MKKLFLLLLSALLLCFAAQAEQLPQAEPQTESAAGTWVLEEERLLLPEAGYKLLDEREMRIILHEDGAAWGDNGREEAGGSWLQEDERVSVTLDGTQKLFTLKDGQLISDASTGLVLVMERGHIGEAIDPAQVVGIWSLASAEFEGEMMDAAALEAGGMQMILTLYPNGSAWGDNGQSQMGGSWEASGDSLTITIDDDSLPFCLVEGRLIGEEVDGVVMYLARTGEVEAPVEDMAGKWIMTRALTGGEELDAEALAEEGMQMHLTLFDDGNAWGDNGYNQVGGSWVANGTRVYVTIGSDTLLFTFADGQLVGDEIGGTVMHLTREEDLPPTGPEGRWRLVSVTSGGQSVQGDALADMGLTMVIELREDGTAWGDNGVTPAEGTWAEQGDLLLVTIADEPMGFCLTDGQLVTQGGSVVMTFDREEAHE